MNRECPTLRVLLSHPDVHALVPTLDLERIESGCVERDSHDEPVYLRFLSAAGAWVASFFLILFLVFADLIADGSRTMTIGILFLIFAMGLLKISGALFVTQFSLSLAFTGNGLVLIALGQWFELDHVRMFFFAQLLITCMMIPMYESKIYRYVSPLVTVAMAVIWIYHSRQMVWLHVLIAMEMIGLAAIMMAKRLPVMLEPVKTAVIEMLPLTILFMNLITIHGFHRTDRSIALWPSSLILTAGLLMLVRWLSVGFREWSRPGMILLVSTTVLLGLFTTPGILVAIGLMILGYAWDDRRLATLAYLFLACFLVLYYYSLDIDLAVKSWIIGGSGLVLLVARLFIRRWVPAEKSS